MYYIQEVQTTNNVPAATPTHSYESYDQAYSVFYNILASAAISEVEYHTVVMFDETGRFVDSKCFHHPIPQPEEPVEETEL